MAHIKRLQLEFLLPLGRVGCSKSTWSRCIAYRNSTLRNSSHENKEIQNFCPLLCLNMWYRERSCMHLCCEKRSASGHCGTVYTTPILTEALEARVSYSGVIRWTRRSMEALRLDGVNDAGCPTEGQLRQARWRQRASRYTQNWRMVHECSERWHYCAEPKIGAWRHRFLGSHRFISNRFAAERLNAVH